MAVAMQKSLGKAIVMWSQVQGIRNTPVVKLLKTTFKIYVFSTAYSFIADLSADEFLDFCHGVDLANIDEKQVFEDFDKAFDARVVSGKVSKKTKGNYRSALIKFFRWLNLQSWYSEQLITSKPKISPKRVYAKKRIPRQYEGDRVYGIKESNLTEELRHQLDKYEYFWSRSSHIDELKHFTATDNPKDLLDFKSLRLARAQEETQSGKSLVRPIVSKVSTRVLRDRRQIIRAFWGWCVHIEEYSIDEVRLDWLTHQAFYLDFIKWLIQKRGCGYNIGETVLSVSLSVAKFYTFHQSQKSDWSDSPLVKFIRHKIYEFSELDAHQQVDKQEEKRESKHLSHQQAQEVVKYLYQFCTIQCSAQSKGWQGVRKRNLSAYVTAWQVYLIVKFLVYAPVRQQELRNLKIGTTLRLVQDAQGITRYAVRIKDHKRVNISGKPRYYPLPSILTQDITTWIEEIRPLAIEASSDFDQWLNFWGHSLTKLNRLKQRAEVVERTENLNSKRLKNIKDRIRGMESKVQAWDVAKQNAEICEDLFFTLGATYVSSFCKAWKASTLSSFVTTGVSGATQALYGEAKYISPHRFRYTGAKHLRVIGRNNDKEAFSAFLGHTVEIDDDYANVVTDDFEMLEDFVDDWWC